MDLVSMDTVHIQRKKKFGKFTNTSDWIFIQKDKYFIRYPTTKRRRKHYTLF